MVCVSNCKRLWVILIGTVNFLAHSVGVTNCHVPFLCTNVSDLFYYSGEHGQTEDLPFISARKCYPLGNFQTVYCAIFVTVFIQEENLKGSLYP